MSLFFFRVAMSFIEGIRISDECLAAGFGAEIDRPAAIFEARKIYWVGIPEFSPTEGDEGRELLLIGRIERHTFTVSVSLPR